MRPNLMLHAGADAVDRVALSNVVIPPATKTWHPIAHSDFLDIVEDKMADVGFRFGDQAHGMTKEGKRYFGLVHLMNGTWSDQHALVMGVRNSIDKSFPAAIAFGSQVFVCDNLAFTGEIKVTRKHTTHIMRDLPGLVASAVSQTRLMSQNQDLRFEQYKETKISTKLADHLIIEMLRRGVVNTSRIEKVVGEWDEPSHDFGGRTAWRLFNATTEALKGAPLHEMPGRTITLQAIIDEVSGFTPRTVIEGEYARVA
jgi:hypothetical protein